MLGEKDFFIYILASKRNGVIYTGVTSDLIKRIWQHKNNVNSGFTSRYKVYKLVYYEVHSMAESALRRERRLKEWQRQWKIDLIEGLNPEWKDLYSSIL